MIVTPRRSNTAKITQKMNWVMWEVPKGAKRSQSLWIAKMKLSAKMKCSVVVDRVSGRAGRTGTETPEFW